MSDSATPWTIGRQSPLSMEFSKQEYWGGLPFPTPEDLPNLGIKPASLISPALAGRFFTTSATWEAPRSFIKPYIWASQCSFSEKAMAPHSSTLAWKTPWTEEPGRLQSMGSQSQTWLSDFTFTFHFYALEKEMATHSSVLAWRIPGMRLHRVRHDWSDLAVAVTVLFMHTVRSIWAKSPLFVCWFLKCYQERHILLGSLLWSQEWVGGGWLVICTKFISCTASQTCFWQWNILQVSL